MEPADPDNPGPGVTWALQRRVPHAQISVLTGSATTEGVTDPVYYARRGFGRDDRYQDRLTLKFTAGGGTAIPADYTAEVLQTDQKPGRGRFTQA